MENGVIIGLTKSAETSNEEIKAIKLARFLVRIHVKAAKTDIEAQFEPHNISNDDPLMYAFDDIQNLHFIVPHVDTSSTMVIYVQPKPKVMVTKLLNPTQNV